MRRKGGRGGGGEEEEERRRRRGGGGGGGGEEGRRRVDEEEGRSDYVMHYLFPECRPHSLIIQHTVVHKILTIILSITLHE